MTKMKDGIQIANEYSKKIMQKNYLKAKKTIERLFKSYFLHDSNDLINIKTNGIQKKLEKIINKAESYEIPQQVSLMWIKVFLEKYEKEIWEDVSQGQEANLFVASNSTDLNPSFIFGEKIIRGKLEGNFGISFDIEKFEHIHFVNDLVPFSYMLTHNHIPKAIIFIGKAQTIEEVKKNEMCTQCTKNEKVRSTLKDCSNPAGLVIERARKYVEDVQEAKHYADLDAYKHVIEKNGNYEFKKIPIIKAIYIEQTGQIYKLNNDCTMGQRLDNYLKKELSFEKSYFEEIISNLNKFHNNNNYRFYKQNVLKEIGCVDARIRSILSPYGMIKEIGSVLNKSQLNALKQSKIEYLIATSHTYCGYINTLYEIYQSNKELANILGDKNPTFRKILQASYSKILDGEVNVLFGDKEFYAALDEMNISLSNKTKNILYQIISSETNDIRKTLRHALFRQKAKISSEGYFVFPAAQKIDQMLEEFNIKISKENFEYLLEEEHARENYELLKNELGDKITISGYLLDIKRGYKTQIPANLPKDKTEVYVIERNLFYEPTEKITINFENQNSQKY